MANTDNAERSAQSLTTLYQALTSPGRREIVRFTSENSDAPVGKDKLGRRLAAVTNDKRPDAVTDDERQRARLELHHRELPALTDAGLLAETDDGAVVTTDHWMYDTFDVADAFGDEPSDELDAVLSALADERRRAILSVLNDQDLAVSARFLARAVAARETGSNSRSVPDDRVDRVLASLVHVHLPVLADAELIAYDADSFRVVPADHPAMRDEWLELDRDRDATDRNAVTALVARVAGLAQSGD